MIDAVLKFQSADKRIVIERFLSLPDEIRPIRHSIGEDEKGVLINNHKEFVDLMCKKQSGFFLKGKNILYDINIREDISFVCKCSLDAYLILARRFLVHMASARPLFAFACVFEELCHWNRVYIKLGINSIESWVGRDIQKYIPGLYWLTLLPAALAQQHDVSLSAIEDIALEHDEIEPGLHLFRFYDRPEDWRDADHVAKARSAIPGIFDVEKVKPLLPAAKTFLELNAILRPWS